MAAVGEVNVVNEMKATQAIIGGEGNGGIIYPELHYGRDALVGIALFLSLVAERKKRVSVLKASYPAFYMSKNKITLKKGMDVDAILVKVKERFEKEAPSTVDGVKIDFEDSWVHLRKSNTEPIIRIYTEAKSQDEAVELAAKFTEVISNLM